MVEYTIDDVEFLTIFDDGAMIIEWAGGRAAVTQYRDLDVVDTPSGTIVTLTRVGYGETRFDLPSSRILFETGETL